MVTVDVFVPLLFTHSAFCPPCNSQACLHRIHAGFFRSREYAPSRHVLGMRPKVSQEIVSLGDATRTQSRTSMPDNMVIVACPFLEEDLDSEGWLVLHIAAV
ncbi:hypothetical protein P152DRAFT_265523 [Eremomyces bilateralis CBS 781.70]|uniref:Uncharacterized protein n=1 Tax=Eremomyces bilateralis CBS 781.70 TaxID=1392243 RepID=A0A6G1G899_9PEZI|nr:uncharacterized protein P152DRAFT_265523 [Eremomyces bilateralis CBS 781.70]KAF1814253.1 hypothetical protein P152DRAFT_265523 [Eremomyces bilateralis CBS 781.70]